MCACCRVLNYGLCTAVRYRFSADDAIGQYALLPTCTGTLVPSTPPGDFTVRCTVNQTFYSLCKTLLSGSPAWKPATSGQLVYFEASESASRTCAVDTSIIYDPTAGYQDQCKIPEDAAAGGGTTGMLQQSGSSRAFMAAAMSQSASDQLSMSQADSAATQPGSREGSGLRSGADTGATVLTAPRKAAPIPEQQTQVSLTTVAPRKQRAGAVRAQYQTPTGSLRNSQLEQVTPAAQPRIELPELQELQKKLSAVRKALNKLQLGTGMSVSSGKRGAAAGPWRRA